MTVINNEYTIVYAVTKIIMESSFFDRNYRKMAEQAANYANTKYKVCFILVKISDKGVFVSTNEGGPHVYLPFRFSTYHQLMGLGIKSQSLNDSLVANTRYINACTMCTGNSR